MQRFAARVRNVLHDLVRLGLKDPDPMVEASIQAVEKLTGNVFDRNQTSIKVVQKVLMAFKAANTKGASEYERCAPGHASGLNSLWSICDPRWFPHFYRQAAMPQANPTFGLRLYYCDSLYRSCHVVPPRATATSTDSLH